MRRTPIGGSGTGHGRFTQVELLKVKKNGQFPDESGKNKSRTNSLCNLPDVLPIGCLNETAVGGLLLQSSVNFRISSVTDSLIELSDLSTSLG